MTFNMFQINVTICLKVIGERRTFIFPIDIDKLIIVHFQLCQLWMGRAYSTYG